MSSYVFLKEITKKKVVESRDLEYFKQWCNLNSGLRLDRNSKNGDILWHVGQDIPSNLITEDVNLLKSSYVELNLRNDKWLTNCSNNPHLSLIGDYLNAVGKTDLHPST